MQGLVIGILGRSRRATRREDALSRLCGEAQALLVSLGLGARFAMTELHQAVQRQLGRPVHLLPSPMPVLGPCGFWVSTDRAEYIFYDGATSPVHQHAVVSHEFGHLLFGDGSTPAEISELAALLVPVLDPAVVNRLQARTRYAQHREWRAEVFASVVVTRLGGWSQAPLPRTADPAVLARLAAALEWAT